MVLTGSLGPGWHRSSSWANGRVNPIVPFGRLTATRREIADDSQSQALRLRPLKPEHHYAENLDITKNYGHTVCNAG